MKNVPLDLLSTFVMFAESPSISVTAKRLGLSQPAVSVQLRKLEEHLPRPLFVFQGKRKVLSHYGQAVYQGLRDRLKAIDNDLDRVNLIYAEPERLKLRVGLRPEILSLGGARIKFPGKVRFLSLSNPEILDRLAHNEIDCGITYVKPDDPNVLAKELFSQHMQFCVADTWLKGRKLDAKLASDREFLTQTPCLGYKEEEPPFLSEWARHCGLEPTDLKIRVVCEDWYAIVRMVEQGIGWTIAPSGVVPFAKAISAWDVPEKVLPKRIFYLLYAKSLRNVPGIRDFLEFTGSGR
jgi:LysR family transcriptional regulator, salicylic acid-responsive activator of bsdBCD